MRADAAPDRDRQAQAVAYLGLGSSIGDRLANLQSALDRLQIPDGSVVVDAVSRVYQSPHMGLQPGDEQRYPPHLNAVARIHTTLPPEALLRHAQAVEAAGGRQRAARWGPRTIDIDILLYGDVRLHSPRLEVPHPGLAQRAFVALPLADLAPDLRLPDGRAVSELVRSEPIRGQRIEAFDGVLRLANTT